MSRRLAAGCYDTGTLGQCIALCVQTNSHEPAVLVLSSFFGGLGRLVVEVVCVNDHEVELNS